ncbi:flagellar basal body rod protein [bacterium]|nr:flagellar basal body rod protein [bacterium]
MLRPVGISSSGIFASLKLLDTTAHNVANSNTDGFKRHSVSFKEAPLGGVQASVSIDPSPGARYLDMGIAEASNVELAYEMVSLMTAKHMLSINAAALKTGFEMEKSIIDIIA